MSKGTPLKLYEVRSFLKSENTTGTGQEEFYLSSGSRILVTLYIEAIDPSTTVKISVLNTLDTDTPYDTIGLFEGSAPGYIKRVYSDFNTLFRLQYEVVGAGAASFKVGVAVFDNASTTRIDNAQIDVDLDAVADVLGHYDSVRIGDGQYELKINPDGSITVVPEDASDELLVYPYAEITNVPMGVESLVTSYTVPVGKTGYLQRVECSGENIACYKVYHNGNPIGTQRTYFGSNLNAHFEFGSIQKKSYELNSGDLIEIKVSHNRPAQAGFEARIQLVVKG